MGKPQIFSTFFKRETTFMTSCLFPWMMKSFKQGVDSERKEFTVQGANLSFFEWTLVEKGVKNEKGVISPKMNPFTLNW